MAKREIIWSNVAIKKLYHFLEVNIEKEHDKKRFKKLRTLIKRKIRYLKRRPETGLKTSRENVLGLKINDIILFYEIRMDRIIVHSIRFTVIG